MPPQLIDADLKVMSLASCQAAPPRGKAGRNVCRIVLQSVKSHPTPTPRLARKNDPSDVAETGGAEPQIAEQSRSWRGAIGEREVMRGS